MNSKRTTAAALVTTATLALTGCAAVLPGGSSAGAAGTNATEPAPTPVRTLKVTRVSPSPETYGVGIVVRVTFDDDVPKAARDAVTSRITVTASKEIGESGWAWTDARTAVYRPKDFWPGHTKVSISASATGEVLGTRDGHDILWGGYIDQSFKTGAEQIVKVNGKTLQATVVRDGQTIRTMPVSLGKSGWETRSGIKVLMEKYEVKRMTSGSIGAEEDYELDVPYAIRLTDSGEFIHAAPWATGRLGNYNGSHGCTNLSVSDARWLFNNRLWGDPVVTTGTPRGMEANNGAGGVWNVSWKQWLTGSVA